MGEATLRLEFQNKYTGSLPLGRDAQDHQEDPAPAYRKATPPGADDVAGAEHPMAVAVAGGGGALLLKGEDGPLADHGRHHGGGEGGGGEGGGGGGEALRYPRGYPGALVLGPLRVMVAGSRRGLSGRRGACSLSVSRRRASCREAAAGASVPAACLLPACGRAATASLARAAVTRRSTPTSASRTAAGRGGAGAGYYSFVYAVHWAAHDFSQSSRAPCPSSASGASERWRRVAGPNTQQQVLPTLPPATPRGWRRPQARR